ncbi:MAG: DUF4249 family protein [Crocinitomix sp.]|nr:DUF4249 family protein [Crocinitomix sp.]
MKKFLFLILPMLIFSCRPKDIDINVESEDSKLVVFSHVIPNSYMLISLTQSFSALEPQDSVTVEDLLVGGAAVSVKFNNETIEFYELAYGLYASVETPTTAGINYELTAIKGNDTITALSTMLAQATLEEATPIITKTVTDTNTAIRVSFEDNPSEDNWYIINVYKKGAAAETDGIDGVNFFGNGSNVLAKTVLLSDNEIPGMYTATLNLDNVHHTDSIVVTLSNIDEQYFNFLNLKQGTGNVFASLNLEPVNYPSNVNNGYGFFNTHYPDIRFYDLSEY